MLSELSHRELEVLKLLVMGHSNEQISKKLFIAPSTVKAHVQAILYKLNVRNRIQAATIAAYFFEIKPEFIVKTANRLKVSCPRKARDKEREQAFQVALCRAKQSGELFCER